MFGLTELLHSLILLTGYVFEEGAFPPPLNAEEERKYLSLCKKGDTAAKNILIEHNLRLVAHIAGKYTVSGCDGDDLISIGTIGLIKGINTFSEDKNSRLAAYIARCIENEILMVIRSRKKLGNEVSIDDTIGTDKEGNNFTFSDILASDTVDFADNLFDKIEMKRLKKAMSVTLTKGENDILCMHYGLYGAKRKTQREIAEMMGISRSYVSRIEKKALQKLYNAMK